MRAVHGCRDLAPIPGATVFRTQHSAVVICNDTQHTAYVTCARDGRWVGDVINCTRPTSGMRQGDDQMNQLHKVVQRHFSGVVGNFTITGLQ